MSSGRKSESQKEGRATRKERWSRQEAIPGFGAGAQERLRRSKVAVLGVGGIGGVAALYLAAAGVGAILLADRDVVELSNLNRQILFAASDEGSAKAEVGAGRLRSLDPELEVETVVKDLDEPDMMSLIRGCHFVLDCLDGNSARLALNRACVQQKIPAVHGFAQDFSGEMFTVIPGEGACLACALDESFPELDVVPVIGVATGVVGVAMAAASIRYLTGMGDLMAGQRLIYDLAFPDMIKIPVERNSRCPVCAII